jgi:hypothetical protein
MKRKMVWFMLRYRCPVYTVPKHGSLIAEKLCIPRNIPLQLLCSRMALIYDSHYRVSHIRVKSGHDIPRWRILDCLFNKTILPSTTNRAKMNTLCNLMFVWNYWWSYTVGRTEVQRCGNGSRFVLLTSGRLSYPLRINYMVSLVYICI